MKEVETQTCEVCGEDYPIEEFEKAQRLVREGKLKPWTADPSRGHPELVCRKCLSIE